MTIDLPAPNKLLTAEEYRLLPDCGQRTELYRGVVIVKGQAPIPCANDAPKIVFEFVSPANTRLSVLEKIGEYLWSGVNVVCVVDYQFKVVNLHYPDRPTERLQGDNLLAFDDLPGLRVPVRLFFE